MFVLNASRKGIELTSLQLDSIILSVEQFRTQQGTVQGGEDHEG